MLYPIKNGSVELVYPEPDAQPKEVHIPPVGWGINKEGKLKKIGVYRRHKFDKECYWERDLRFNDFAKWKNDEEEKQKHDKNYSHPELNQFISDCWTYRDYGFWFVNDGEPTYITGDNWFFLSIIPMEKGDYADYRDTDRLLFYFWELCEQDPLCLGILYITMRRDGKTFKASSIGLNKATKTKNFKMGIQSKNDKDAAKVFNKAISTPYKKFPYFFRLNKDNTNYTKQGITFTTPKLKYSEDDFDTMIDYRSSDNYAYDGSMLNYYIADEVGKPQAAGVDINERLGVVEYCMKNNRSEIIGKMFVTSTVEEMGGAAAKLRKMWDTSNSEVISEDTEATGTGLWRYFKPAHEVLLYDKYGKVDKEKSLAKIMREREPFKNDARRLAEKIRKQPTSVKEAFMTSTETCMFNPLLLDDREAVLLWDKTREYYKRGNFAWVDEIWGDVKFVPNPNGEVYLVEDIPKELRNRRGERFGFPSPQNSHLFSMGVDPYDLKTFINEHNKRDLSDGSFAIIKKPSDTYPMEIDNGIICFFRHRYVDPFMFYKQTIMAAIYFSCEALIERNRDGLLAYMEREGLQLYCTMLPKETKRGIHASLDTNGTIFELTDQYITEHIDKVNFPRLIEDWKGFDPTNTTKFDGAMSVGYALMQWDMRKPKKAVKNNSVKEIEDLFRFYKR